MENKEKVDRIIDFVVAVVNTYNARLNATDSLVSFSGTWIDRLNNGVSIHLDIILSDSIKITIVNSSESFSILDFFVDNRLSFYILVTELTVERFTEELKKYAWNKLKSNREIYLYSSRNMEHLLELTGAVDE